ncbi:hypothetical protein LJB91_00690 [Bacteroidales bacterium OttesenSCG-928-L03]|nr:hypothetical protein [Bacteroidales bacterium OttesenSCG-928-L03]
MQTKQGICILLMLALSCLPLLSQDNKLNFKFYGFIRTDAYFDSRQSVTANEGLLFLYPKDIQEDAGGEDLNAVPNSGGYSFVSRPGVEVSGLRVLGADLSGKLEADFAGFSGNGTLLRIRLAYMNFRWGDNDILVGQQWHPFFGPVIPGQLSITTGIPFQPFNRSPQIQYSRRLGKFTLSGAALYQFQYMSQGPDGKTNRYHKQAILPELVFTANYKHQGIEAGVGLDFLKIKPRSQRTMHYPTGDLTYKTDESVSSLSYQAYLKYTEGIFSASVKSGLMENPTHLTMLGGYGISKVKGDGSQEYTPFQHSTTLVNLSYGKKYLGNLYGAYTKNLGSKKALAEDSAFYGEGMNIQELYRLCGNFSYNVPHFRLGIEYEYTVANYGRGAINWNDGLYASSKGVDNHRLIGTVSYIF